MRTIAILAFAAPLPLCHAEPRWCEISSGDASNTIAYPPIAKAARVEGTVLAHIIYSPAGSVEDVQSLFGPVMLSRSVNDQLKKWTVKTNATGDALCQTLIIVDFHLQDPDHPIEYTPPAPPPGAIRLSINGELLILSDPGGYVTKTHALRRWLTKFWRTLSRNNKIQSDY